MNEYDIIREGLNVMRRRRMLTEEVNRNNNDAVPYSREDELMTSIMETAKTQFGADFSKYKTPMLYYPKDGDVTLSGEISDLNGLKFQFRYKDSSGNGCYIFVDNEKDDNSDVVNKYLKLLDDNKDLSNKDLEEIIRKIAGIKGKNTSSFIQLTDETIRKFNIIYGVFKNWKRSLASAEDIKPMSLKNEDEEENNPPMVPGDDIM